MQAAEARPFNCVADDVVPCTSMFAQSLVIEERQVGTGHGLISGFTARDTLPLGTCHLQVVAQDSQQTFAVAAAASKGLDEEEPGPNDVGKPAELPEGSPPFCLESSPSLLMSAATLPSSCLNSGCNAVTAAALGVPPCGVKAVCGKRAKMEDAFSVQTCFFDLPANATDDIVNKVPARIATQIGGQLDVSLSLSNPLPRPLSMRGSHAIPHGEQDPFSAMSDTSETSDAGGDTLHFYGVYDGHGGTEAAQHCANRLHHHLSEALAALGSACMQQQNALCTSKPEGGVHCQAEWRLLRKGAGEGGGSDDAAAGAQEGEPGRHGPFDPAQLQPPLQQQPTANEGSCGGEGQAAQQQQQQQQQQALQEDHASSKPTPTTSCAASSAAASVQGPSAASQADHGSEAATELLSEPPSTLSDLCSSGCDASSDPSDADASHRSPTANTSCITLALENALKEAFLRTDAEFATDGSAAMVGSTAVVALVGSRKAWVANCGDSRAVLCRGSKAIQLTDDHKPEREDEAERVERAGGQVLYWNGHRVMGVLAMSRAIGDHGLRPYVIPEPEVTVFTRAEDDDFLLLASDGLWDVMSNQEAISLAMRCSTRAWEKGASRKAAVRIAASVLTKAAVDRGSKDNVTVVIIDLASNAHEERSNEPPPPPAAPASAPASSETAQSAAGVPAARPDGTPDSKDRNGSSGGNGGVGTEGWEAAPSSGNEGASSGCQGAAAAGSMAGPVAGIECSGNGSA